MESNISTMQTGTLYDNLIFFYRFGNYDQASGATCYAQLLQVSSEKY